MLQKKSPLGRGLSALIDSPPVGTPKVATNEIDLSLIDVNPFQPRQNFAEEALLELAASIRQYGVIQPITVREVGEGRYQIISGERRFRASKLAGLAKIPAFVRHADDNALLELALVENVQREDLDPIEVALSYQRLIDEFGFSQDSLSEKVGKKRSTISNSIRLLKLPAEIQLALRNRKINMGHARALVAVESREVQIKTCLQIIEKDLSVRQAEELAAKVSKESAPPQAPKNLSNPQLKKAGAELAKRLTSLFPNPVKVTTSSGQGKISIPFSSAEQLVQIIALFDKLKG